MSTETMAGEIQTYTGKWVNPLDVDPNQVELADIAHALAMTCRFSGHCQQFYSVAEHCVRVSLQLQLQHRHNIPLLLLGLLHDAAEAYLPDLVAPIKPHFSVRVEDENQTLRFKTIELRAIYSIYRGLGLNSHVADIRDREMQARVKHADLT